MSTDKPTRHMPTPTIDALCGICQQMESALKRFDSGDVDDLVCADAMWEFDGTMMDYDPDRDGSFNSMIEEMAKKARQIADHVNQYSNEKYRELHQKWKEPTHCNCGQCRPQRHDTSISGLQSAWDKMNVDAQAQENFVKALENASEKTRLGFLEHLIEPIPFL